MFTLFWACPNLPKLSRPHNNGRFWQKMSKNSEVLSYDSLCMIFVIFNQKICFIFGQIMRHLFIEKMQYSIGYSNKADILVENDNNLWNSLIKMLHSFLIFFVKIGHCASDVYLLEKNAYLEVSSACLTTINNTTNCCSTTLPLY